MLPTPAGTTEYTDGRLNGFLARILDTIDRTIRPCLDLDVNHNATHTETELLGLLTHCGLTHEFANGGAKTRQYDAEGTVVRSDIRCPISRALGRHPRQLDFGAIMTQSDAVFEELLT